MTKQQWRRRDFVTNRESKNKFYTVFIPYQGMTAKNNFPIFNQKLLFRVTSMEG